MILSELRANAWKYACLVAAVLAVAGLVAALLFRGNSARAGSERDAAIAQRDAARGEVVQLTGVIESERSKAQALANIATQYEKEKTDAQAVADRTIADLRAGHLRLRKLWTCPAPAASAETDTSAGEPDGQAELREQGAADLVRLAAEADAQIRGLQAVIEADRRP